MIHGNLMQLFLSSMQITWITLTVVILETILHPLWLYIFVYKLELGVTGCGIANCISQFTYFFFITLSPLRLKNINEAFFWPNKKDCFSKWGEFF